MARYSKSNLVEDLTLHDVFAATSKAKVAAFVDDFLTIISERVAAGDEVALSGFGKFEKFTRLNGSVKPKFSAYKDFKDSVSA